MRAMAMLFLLAGAGVLILLAMQNQESVTLVFLDRHIAAEVWMIGAAGYLMGMLSGWSVVWVVRRSWRRALEPGRSA